MEGVRAVAHLNNEKGEPTMKPTTIVATVFTLLGTTAAVQSSHRGHVYKHAGHRSHAHKLVPVDAGIGFRNYSYPTTPTYGTSGSAIGTVTAPSIGSYNWPSVGVTNAVPTWRNTNPPLR